MLNVAALFAKKSYFSSFVSQTINLHAICDWIFFFFFFDKESIVRMLHKLKGE